MINSDKLETMLVKMNVEELINYCFSSGYIKKERKCIYCNNYMELKKNNNIKIKLTWRCCYSSCRKYRNRVSILKDSFFENFNISIVNCFKILIRWSNDVQITSIVRNLNIKITTVKKVIKKFLDLCGPFNFHNNKLGGVNKIVQIDETMLNFKCKSHRGRSPHNKTDALVMVEVEDKIKRVFAVVIPDKRAETILPIICNNIINGSVIWTDEHKSYSQLTSKGFLHSTVCHKYNFVDKETGTHTQAVESFNNCIKIAIKKRKGVVVQSRQDFLNEICWLFNNKENRLERILNIIKA